MAATALLQRRAGAGSVVSEYMFNVPPGTNPFRYGAEAIDRLVFFSDQPRWFKANLGAIGAVFLLSIILHGAAVLIPVLRGKAARAKHLWLVRSKHSVNHRTKLYFPNGRLLACIFSTISATLVLVFAAYLLFDPANANNAVATFTLLTLWCTIWFCAFDALYVVWGSSVHRAASAPSRFLQHPWFLNTVCWVTPLFAVASLVGVMAKLCIYTTYSKHGSFAIAQSLLEAADQYDQGGLASVTNLETILQQWVAMQDIYDGTQRWQQVSFILCIAWLSLEAITFAIAFYLVVRAVSRHLAILGGRRALVRVDQEPAATRWLRAMTDGRASFSMARTGDESRRQSEDLPKRPRRTSRISRRTSGDMEAATVPDGELQPAMIIRANAREDQHMDTVRMQYRVMIGFFAMMGLLLVTILAALLFATIRLDELVLSWYMYQTVVVVLFWPFAGVTLGVAVLSLYRTREMTISPLEMAGPSQMLRRTSDDVPVERRIGLFDRLDELADADADDENRARGGSSPGPALAVILPRQDMGSASAFEEKTITPIKEEPDNPIP